MLGRVEGPLYYKRKHDGSLSPKWHLREPSWKRAVWIEFGIGMLEAMMPLLSHAEHESGLAIILERLCCPRDARFRFYDPAVEPIQFAQDFLREARARCNIAARSHTQDQRVIDQALGRWLAAEALPPAEVALAELTEKLLQSGASLPSASRKARSAPGCFKTAGPFQNRGRRGLFRMSPLFACRSLRKAASGR